MADPFQLSLLKKSERDWNRWREKHSDILIDLSYANLSNAYLKNANLKNADLSSTNLSYTNLDYANLEAANLKNANLSRTNLSYANLNDANLSAATLSGAMLNNAKLGGANLRNANLSKANLNCTNLYNADFTEVNLTQTTREEYPFFVQFYVMPKWANVVVGGYADRNRFFTNATLDSIAQGVDIIERRWNEQKEMGQQNDPPRTSLSSSSNPSSADSEIIKITLLMDDGQTHYDFTPQTADFEFLRTSLTATEGIKPLYVIFQKREGHELVLDVREDGIASPPLNLILSYLEADLQ